MGVLKAEQGQVDVVWDIKVVGDRKRVDACCYNKEVVYVWRGIERMVGHEFFEYLILWEEEAESEAGGCVAASRHEESCKGVKMSLGLDI